MTKRIDIAGKVFGSLLVTKYAYAKSNSVYWHTICECGVESIKRGDDMRRGKTTSCGCQQVRHAITHGHTNNRNTTPEFNAWRDMKARCYRPLHKSYHRYGERGITVCPEWLDSFEQFFADMGSRPSPEHTLERIDNEGNYNPDNCKWDTRKVQGNNRSTNHFYTIAGETMTQTQWCERCGVNISTFRDRVARGWTVPESLGLCDRNIAVAGKD